MPNTIKFSDNPNEETAFITTEDNTRTRAVLTTVIEGTVKFPDNPNSTKVNVEVDGVSRKAVAVYNLNGGGGDPHNKGHFATPQALEEAYPTAEAGDFATVESTDTIWIWDNDEGEWVDSHKIDSVTSVNGKTGVVVLDAKDVAAIPQHSTMPATDAGMEGDVAQYKGTTDANYTQGYFYKCTRHDTPSSLTATQTVGTGLTFMTDVAAFESYQHPTGDETIEFECKYRMSTFTDWTETGIIGALGTFDSLLLAHNISMQDDVNWETNSSDVVTMEMLPSGLLSISDQLGAFETFTITMDEFNTYFYDYEGTFEIGEYATCTYSRGERLWYQGDTEVGTYLYYGYGISVYGTPKQHDVVTAVYTAVVSQYTWDNIAVQESVQSVNGKTGVAVLSAEDVGAIPQYSTMPTATEDYEGEQAQYVGTTTASYTNGYFYKCEAAYGPGISAQVTVGSITIYSTNVTSYLTSFPGIPNNDVKTFVYKTRADGGQASAAHATNSVGTFYGTLTLADLKAYWQSNIDPYISQWVKWKTSGVNTAYFEYQGNDTWNLTSPYPSSPVTPTTSDFATAGITITGTPEVGDVLIFSASEGSHWEVSDYYNMCFPNTSIPGVSGALGTAQSGDTIQVTYSENTPIGYAWQRTDVQPTPSELPDQTGHSGEFLITDGANVSWSGVVKVNTTATLAVADWSSSTQTVSVTGITATGIVFVNPATASQADYTSAGVLCTGQAAGTLTFTCDTVPTNDISVVVVML